MAEASTDNGESQNERVGRHERFRGEYPIQVEGLVNRFGDQTIHDGLDLNVKRGEILGVVGGSGTGKSVLMRSIIGLQPPTEGSIKVFGRSITDADPDEALGIRDRWGVLFQGGALFSTLTVGENVEVPLKQFYPDLSPELMHDIARYKVLLSGNSISSSRLRCRASPPDRRSRPDRSGGVRPADASTEESARPHRIPDHARSRQPA